MSQWLRGWKHRLKMAISSDDIDANLTHFPVMIKLARSCGKNGFNATKVFEELGANKLKLAVTKADGVTQLFVEIEYWSATEQLAILWVSRDGWVISSTTDTIVYLYFDATKSDNSSFVGVAGSTPGQAVWDSNFKLVCHMDDNPDTSHVKDSTANGNDGTKDGVNTPEEVTTLIGKSQDFDAEKINVGNDSSLDLTDDMTFTCWINKDDVAGYEGLFSAGTGSYTFAIFNSNPCFIKYGTSNHFSTGAITALTDIQLAFTITGGKVHFYINGIFIDSLNIPSLGNINTVYLGAIGTGDKFSGRMDEPHFSVNRSSAWIGASYETQNDSLLSISLEAFETVMQGPPVPRPPLKRTFWLKLRDWLESKSE